jgi:hybrid polyketide synthase / nonribosomal peptide synthetase ACE1
VIKASLALQNSQIPPNMLLNELAPSVRPFYNDLCILKEAKEWPGGPTNELRRASVNSFGFGGANAHAILENYLPATEELAREERDNPFSIAPFNFSAGTEKSLKRLLASYASYIDANPSVNLRDLSWTLNTRRSNLASRISIAAASTEALSTKLKEASETANGVLTVSGSQSANGSPRLLGIFTGQGAQWASMGADLLKDCTIFSDCIDRLQNSLASLPAEHRPAWTIREELAKDKTTSRVGEAELSQPLCTAVQIGLVSILQAAKVELAAVVGHSSGEIAAAFAAGYLSAEDAIRVAYYRGYFLRLSGSESGSQGAMMAIGTSHEDAEELCELPSLEGRVCIAARNSPSSLTLSGDADAINEAKEILDDEKKFARLLKVDKAYHSPHMKPCFEPYVAALKACGVKALARSNGQKLPVWVSSVTGEHIESLDTAILSGKYWGDNMCQPVLFSQAVEFALGAEGPFDMGIEIGPHPALKGPATSTTKEIAGLDLPYTGTLTRGTSGTEAIALSLGSLWQSLGASVVDFTALDSVIFRTSRGPRLLKGLPTYSWDHDRTYWHESRYSKAFRGRKEQPHDLLGMKCPDGIDQEIRFKNHLSVKEIPWLVHHQIQGQIVFPAAGYVSTVVEAIANLFAEKPVQLLEFENLVIGQALILNESTGVDTILTIKVLEQNASFQLATFGFYSDSGKESGIMVKNASGTIRVIIGPSSEDSLPSPNPCEGRFQELEWERFYLTTAQLGFGYTGPFQSLSNTRRRLGEATGTLGVPSLDDSPGTPLIIHPATLDCAIQSIILAFSYPGDGRLRSIYLPTVIDRLRINMVFCQESTEQPGTQLPFYASMSNEGLSDLSGDVEIHSSDGKSTIIQLEGLHATPLEPPSAANDVKIFTELSWGPETPPGTNVTWEGEEFADDLKLSFMMEKVAYFYLRQIGTEFPKDSRQGYEWHHARLFDYVDHCLEYVASGTHPYAKKEWINDSRDEILKIVDKYD